MYDYEIDIHFLFTDIVKIVIISMLSMIMIITVIRSLLFHYLFFIILFIV